MIEVRIPRSKILDVANPIHAAMRVHAELLAAGVPLVGQLFCFVVQRGTLTQEFDDLANDEFVWRWTE